MTVFFSYDVSGWLASQSFAGGRKRGREESRDSDRKRRCPRRSLDFSDGSPSHCSEMSNRSSSTPTITPAVVTPALTLTHLHKQVHSQAKCHDTKLMVKLQNTAIVRFRYCGQKFPLVTCTVTHRVPHTTRDPDFRQNINIL